MHTIVKAAAAAIIFGALSQPAHADLITADPDDFAAGTDISNAFAGVTLSTVGGNGSSAVFAQTDSNAATGSLSFGNDTVDGSVGNLIWFEGDSFSTPVFDGPVLRADFDHLVDYVSILITNQDSFDGGILRAFRQDGTEIAAVSSIVTGQFGDMPAPVTLSFLAPNPQIAFITVAGQSAQDSVRLDALQFGIVPEPATAALLLTGVGILGFRRRRRH